MGGQPTDRYIRQTTVTEIGSEGQRRLAGSSILVVGCGALGSMLSQIMVRAGVGRVRLVDSDPPEMHNLHRQVLYDEDDVRGGRSKAEIAGDRLGRMNTEVSIEAMSGRATGANIGSLVSDMDLVLDGTDNCESRYLINEACVAARTPWVYGGVVGTTGMVLSILPGEGPCLRCFMPEPPSTASGAHCLDHGILSTAALMVATLQATEALKIIVDRCRTSRDLIAVDVWRASLRSFAVRRAADCPTCVSGRFELISPRPP